MIDEEALKNIEKLHKLKADGVISDEEFQQSKEQLLHGQQRPKARPKSISNDPLRPAADDWMGWIILPLRRYAHFEGRSSRKEYWMFQLSYVALLLLGIPFALLSADLAVAVVILGVFALVVPQIAVTVRRLHDQDRSGWFALFYLLPYVGAFILLVFMFLQGTQGPNQYGDDPLNG